MVNGGLYQKLSINSQDIAYCNNVFAVSISIWFTRVSKSATSSFSISSNVPVDEPVS